ncbi:uncharacterized protein [Pocillopora verrucosa]|uniref:uncharacterized protein n=1 Tax=Pocillopora verrucosa TaxID=203993 RepID=UPI00333EAE05
MKINAILPLCIVVLFASGYVSASSSRCFTCSQPRDPINPAWQVDLNTNRVYSTRDASIVLLERLKVVPGVCTNQGKIRIRFDKCWGSKRTARIDLWFARKVTGFSFDIAQSPTVNGWGGDAGTTNKCAEVHGLHKTFLIYSNDFTGHEDYNTDAHMTVEVKRKVISDHMTIYISHERVEVTNYRGYQAVYDSRYLFQLSGQLIGRPPSTATDVWLSMNRVISGTYRSGTGLCKVAISWV